MIRSTVIALVCTAALLATFGAGMPGVNKPTTGILIRTICSNLSDDRPAMVCRAKEPTGPGRAS